MGRIQTEAVFLAGVFFMILAVVGEFTPLVHGHYGPTLLEALGLTALADICFSIVFWRGVVGWRIAAALLASPTLFIVFDFIRRAPYVFQ